MSGRDASNSPLNTPTATAVGHQTQPLLSTAPAPLSPTEALTEPMDLTLWRHTTRSRLPPPEDIDGVSAMEENFPFFMRLFLFMFTIFTFVMLSSPRVVTPNGLSLSTTFNVTAISPLYLTRIATTNDKISSSGFVGMDSSDRLIVRPDENMVEDFEFSVERSDNAGNNVIDEWARGSRTVLVAKQMPILANISQKDSGDNTNIFSGSTTSDSISSSWWNAWLFASRLKTSGDKLNSEAEASDSSSNPNSETNSNNKSSRKSRSVYPSALAVPALVGGVVQTASFVAPMIILRGDACTPLKGDDLVFPDAIVPFRVKNVEDNISSRSSGEGDDEMMKRRRLLRRHKDGTEKETLTFYAFENDCEEGCDEIDGDDNETQSDDAIVREGESKDKEFGFSSSTQAANIPQKTLPVPDSSSSAPASRSAYRLDNWYALVQRGNCPFDVKIYHAQQAGLAGVIVHNGAGIETIKTAAAGSVGDLPVRMSANSLGDRISNIHALFMTYGAVERIKTFLGEAAAAAIAPRFDDGWVGDFAVATRYLLISLSMDDWPRNGWADTSSSSATSAEGSYSIVRASLFSPTLASIVSDILFLLLILFASSTLCLFVALLMVSLRNWFIHGRLFAILFPPGGNGNDSDGGGIASGEGQPLRAENSAGSPFNSNSPLVWDPMAVTRDSRTTTEDGGAGRRRGWWLSLGFDWFGEDIHDGTGFDFFSDNQQNKDEDNENTLEKITLPIKIITESDLVEGDAVIAGSPNELEGLMETSAVGGSKLCCAICIDEFEVGNRVRKLPCLHQFHDSCVDPWLINHNRLCPICKRDVLLATPTRNANRSSEIIRTANLNVPGTPSILNRTPTLVMEEGQMGDDPGLPSSSESSRQILSTATTAQPALWSWLTGSLIRRVRVLADGSEETEMLQ